MARRKSENSIETTRRPPARTPEALENEMIDDAMRLASKQLKDGSASSQVIVHFLKLGTTKANLEREKIALENELLKAKTEAINSNARIEELYNNAIEAMRNYTGSGDADLQKL